MLRASRIKDIVSCEKTQETLALLKILALAERSMEQGKTVPAATAMRRVRNRIQQARIARHQGVAPRC